MADDFGNEAFFAQMEARMGAMVAMLRLPPPVFIEMGGVVEHLDVDVEKRMVIRFPVQEKYENPLRFMQGGMIAAAIDNTIGPLSFLVAPPSVTLNMNLSYLRPISHQDAFIRVDGVVTEQTRRMIYMAARVLNAQGKLCTLAHATCQVLEQFAG